MEQYTGVKFKTILNNEILTFDSRIGELKYWCKIFHEKNLAPPYQGGSYGNLSFRINSNSNEFIITGSSVGLKEELTDDSFVKVTGCDMEKHLVYATGTRNPSSESMLHFAIYKQRPDINAIFHGHCSLLLKNTNFLGITETEKEESYGTIELVNRVLKISEKENFLNIKKHGFISLGNSMKEAGVKSFVYNMLSSRF
ncbi:MAG: class II aldolase/adducin family protein [Bacteroidetes bacterium]|nr:class II aldolase/adducin family protein [Bacteroidota bacterium]